VDATGYLYTMATVGMSFTGLSVLTMILRQMLGGQMTKFDTFVAGTWVHLGFIVTLGSILPPLLTLFDVSTLMVWRISSGVMAIIFGCWAVTFPKRRLAANPTPLPIPVIIFAAAMDLIALTLAANAVAVPVERASGVYAASLTAILIGAALLFVFAYVHWYDSILVHQKPKA
jgi:membrane associated rhomboid family serine protease